MSRSPYQQMKSMKQTYDDKSRAVLTAESMLPRTKPAPPKFLVVTDDEGNEQTMDLRSPAKLTRPKTEMVPSRFNEGVAPQKELQIANVYKQRVNSRAQAKKTPGTAGTSVSFDMTPGTASTAHTPYSQQTHMNARRPPPRPPPRPANPIMLRPAMNTPTPEATEGPLLRNRLPNGQIIGTYTKNIMDESRVPSNENPKKFEKYINLDKDGKRHVPKTNKDLEAEQIYAEQTMDPIGDSYDEYSSNGEYAVTNETSVASYDNDAPVGPDNPVKRLNDTWSACWDDEAGAVYYYNYQTGEATWLPPKF